MGQYTVDANTISLLHFEDGIKDECNPGFSWVAQNAVVTGDAKKFGNSSLALTDTTSSTFTAPFNLSGDFTIDFRLYITNKNSGGVLYFSNDTSPNATNVVMYVDAYRGGCGILNTGYIDGATKVTQNTWVHLALVKKDSTYRIFVDGKLALETNDSNIPLKYITIGGRHNVCNGWYNSFTGYIDELRVSNVARWTGPFDPDPILNPTPVPMNLIATAGDKKITLSWSAVTGAAGYNVKRAITSGGPYTTIANNVTGTGYEDTNVVNGTTYYYVVTAIGASGESANSNEASATPKASGQELLRVTMSDSSEREYQLPASDIDGFINWFSRAVGTGPNCYMLHKTVGVQNSKEYLAFDKIISFEVMDITK